MNGKDKIKDQIIPVNDDRSANYSVITNSQNIPSNYLSFYKYVDNEGVTPNYVLGYN